MKIIYFIFWLGLAALLNACGFTPMHDPSFGNAASVSAYKNIRVEMARDIDLTEREGAYYLQQSLMDRLGTSGQLYVLKVTPDFRRAGYGISSDDVASRYDLRASAKYELVRASDGAALTSGTVSSVTTFGAPTDPYGRIASERNASEQVARDVADRLIIELGRYFADAANNPPMTPPVTISSTTPVTP